MSVHVNFSKKISFNDFKNAAKNRFNFDPQGWGKHAWPFLFAMAFAYPKNPSIEDASECKNMFEALMIMLPCFNCRNNYKIHLTHFPLDEDVLSTRANLIEWLYNINNAINETLGKPTYSLNETINYYHGILKIKTKSQPKTINSYKYIYVLAMFAMLCILCWCLYKTKKLNVN